MINALGIYRNLGLIILPYFPKNGLDINPAKLKIPNTNPDCDRVAPFDFASAGKNGGSSAPQMPQIIYARLTTMSKSRSRIPVILRFRSIINRRKCSTNRFD